MKKTFIVEIEVQVEVDESKFTPEFMSGFSKHFHYMESVESHMEYIAELAANGAVTTNSEFVEGYGTLSEMGIDFRVFGTDVSESMYS